MIPATMTPSSLPRPCGNEVRPWLRAGVLLLVFLLNPVAYSWWHTAGGVFPDSVSYLQLARQLFESGQLFVPRIGHVDAGLILPPLYPLAVGAASQVHGDAILVSQWISAIALLAATIPLFLWVERAANLWLAAATLITIQLQPFYLVYGTSTLTESFFILGLCLLGCWSGRVLSRPSTGAKALIALGAGVGLLFLVRQIGIFLLPALMVVAVVLRLRPDTRAAHPPLARSLAAMVLGFLAVFGPYAAALHGQSGEFPWTQSFRLGHYEVTGDADAGSASAAGQSYAQVYAGRREMRRLTPDGTEMIGFQVDRTEHAPPLARFANPVNWARNLADNVGHAAQLVGVPLLLLSALGMALCLAIPGSPATTAWRLLLPAFLLGYAVLLSALTGLVERYVEVVVPLLIAQLYVGVYLLAAWLARRQALTPILWAGIAATTAAGATIASGGGIPPPASLSRKVGEAQNPIASCRTLVTRGEGVFSFHPIEAYLLGGTHRIVPNDSLDRIARYARLTNTRWLLYRESPATEREKLLYQYADWLTNLEILASHPGFIPRCGSPVVGAVLFEIAGNQVPE